ncbi:MAG TPA: TolC family protein [Polyangiales bacterium]
MSIASMRFVTAVCTCVLAGAGVAPQLHAADTASAPRAISLTDAIAYAREHQPQLRVALERMKAQEAQAQIARARWLPSVGLTGQLFGATANNTTASYVSTSLVDLPRIGGTRVLSAGRFSPYASSLVGVGATQELFDFGRIAAAAAVDDALVDAQRSRAQAALLDVTFNVEEAYFAVLAAHAIVDAATGAYERSLVHRDLAKAGVDAGLRSPIELTRAQADLENFAVGEQQARGGLALAQSAFAAVTGVSDAALDAAGEPQAPADLPALSDALRQAAARDPAILELLAQLQADELKTRAIASELRPDLSLTATVSGRAGGAPPSGNGRAALADGFVPDVVNWDLGVVFTWPLFDATVGARKAASLADAQVRRAELASARYQQAAAIRAAYLAVDVARMALPARKRAVQAAQANHAQADARFRAGLGTSVELADAEALREQAEVQLAVGQFELARARAAFGRAIAEGL